MDQSGQRFVAEFFFLKGLRSKEIHRKLTNVLGSAAYSLSQIKKWRARFETGDLSCEDQFRPDRLPHVFGKALSDFLEGFPLAITGIIAQHFD
jgi:hypothetical protein